MLKVIYVARINKTAEVLANIAKRSVVSQKDLTTSRDLLNLFAGSQASPERRIIDTIALLSKQGFVSVGEIDNVVIYRITPAGSAHLRGYRASKEALINPNSPWDHTWYLVYYDIPETKKAVRNSIIINLKRQGLLNFTKGLWIFPFDPTPLLVNLRARYALSPDQLQTIIASRIHNERAWQDKFNLTKNTS